MYEFTDIHLVNGQRIRVQGAPETHDYLRHYAGLAETPICLTRGGVDINVGKPVWIAPVHVVAFS